MIVMHSPNMDIRILLMPVRILAKDGHVTYYRDQWQDKNQGQYLIDESKDNHTKI